MESSSRGPFQESANLSSADSSSANSSPVQNPSGSSVSHPADMDATILIDNDGDSASDISMSQDSGDEEDQEPSTPTGQIIADQEDLKRSTTLDTSNPVLEVTKKRKLSASIEPIDELENGNSPDDRKRQKPDNVSSSYRNPQRLLIQDKSLLPAELWHHIFTFCPPKTLGLLLQVNKSFNVYLDPSSIGPSIEPLSKSTLQILTPDAIWRASGRLNNFPAMPLPLLGKSELDMWKIACSSTCQYCGKKAEFDPSVPADQWHSGPGEKGVTPIWSFGVRACGSCLQKRTTKEIELLLSASTLSALMTALPFIFLTNELHALSAAALQKGQHPTSIQITKHYFNSQVQELKDEFQGVKAMGAATTEEWLKGLEGRGWERRNDAARWERWDAAGGVTKMRESGRTQIQPSPTQTNGSGLGTASSSGLPTPISNSSTSSQQGLGSLQLLTSFPKKPVSQLPPIPPMSIHNGLTANVMPRFDSPSQNGLPAHPPPPRPFPQVKHERTKEQVAEMKAVRRAEIEKRCMLLEPPITAGVLAHMSSFQAAIQIIQPLTDSAWDVLMPRLLSQRGEAEQRENDRLAQTRVVQERFDSRRYQDMQARSDSKDLVDREWDDIQAPLRAKIGGYADEIVRDGWNSGEKVSYDTAPLFAAEVLIYVRKRFYAELAKDEAAMRATGREPEMDPPDGPYTRKLILENMKWVFDTKIKPHTEPHRKELFLCNACEYAAKYYGFEGVIQHFAAKHTSALSIGSIVVHWKSEWPEIPPFNPDPDSVKAYYNAAPSASTPYSNSLPPAPQTFGYGGYQPAPVTSSMQIPNVHGYQESPTPYYGNTQYGDQYSNHQNGPYGPQPQTYPDVSQGYQTPQYAVAPQPMTHSGYNGMPQDYPQSGYGTQYQPQAQVAYPQAQPQATYPPPVPEVPQQASYGTPTSQYRPPYPQQANYATNNYSQPPPKTEEYTNQLQNVARNAREVWNAIGSLKEVPGSLKVFTVIYHILDRYRATFQEDPPLSMIVDGLSNNKDMRPVRNVNGLLCKACTLGMAGSNPGPQRKHFSFPQLVNHFHTVHEQGLPADTVGHIPDWTKDMVDLPEMSKLVSVANAPGMDDRKFKFFTDALPELVAPPQPSVGDGSLAPNQQQYGSYSNYEYDQLAPSQDNHEKYYTTIDSAKPSETSRVTYDSGEYDPRNPHDLSTTDARASYKLPRRDHNPRDLEAPRSAQPSYQYDSYQASPQTEVYQERAEAIYADQRPRSQAQARPVADYGRTYVREEPVYVEEPLRYREPNGGEYRPRRAVPEASYDDPNMAVPREEYSTTNNRSYKSNADRPPANAYYEVPRGQDRVRPSENPAAQQNRIFEVVAQISQQAQQAQEREPIKQEPAEAGSEDGEVRAEAASRPQPRRTSPNNDARAAAERFLDNFVPGEPIEPAPKRVDEADPRKESGRRSEPRMIYNQGPDYYQKPMESRRPARIGYDDNDRVYASSRPLPPMEDEYIVRESRPTLQGYQAVAYEDSYADAAGEPLPPRGRSPELVDRRFKLNNVVYRDERQGSHGTYRTPSRYARYESVRLENDRVRSRSPPVYVKVGSQSGQYRERSPGAPTVHQEPIHRTRTPALATDAEVLERQPRQEYYRVYPDEVRPREREVQYELVRVSDPRGDYMIRRPVRREPDPIYAPYLDEVYARQPVYETRAPVSRLGPPTYEEYDPHHPESATAARQIRYQ